MDKNLQEYTSTALFSMKHDERLNFFIKSCIMMFKFGAYGDFDGYTDDELNNLAIDKLTNAMKKEIDNFTKDDNVLNPYYKNHFRSYQRRGPIEYPNVILPSGGIACFEGGRAEYDEWVSKMKSTGYDPTSFVQ